MNMVDKKGHPASFCLFSFFSNTNLKEKTVDLSRIWTQSIRVEGKHADHLTTTMAQHRTCYLINFIPAYHIMPTGLFTLQWKWGVFALVLAIWSLQKEIQDHNTS